MSAQEDTSHARILVIDDTPGNLHLLLEILAGQGYDVRLAQEGALALDFVKSTLPDLILLDIRLPDLDGYVVCEELKTDDRTRDIPVIFISALEKTDEKVRAFAVGGVDYITKPFQPEEVLARVETHLTLYRLRHHLEELVADRTAQLQEALTENQRLQDQLDAENLYLREEIQAEHNFEEIIGQSESLRYLLFKVKQVAETDAPVLILGETGTGKELIARGIHANSPRRNRPLVKVNCAALPSNLIESELFGHEKGAFTGAAAKRIGRFELADGATLFLDEIGELSSELQAKLLRVIQDGEFERLGSSHTMKVNVRLIAATNRDLKTEVRNGQFRQDLYYRLSVYPVTVPPLRNRPDDIPLLVRTFVQKFNKKLGKQLETIPQTTLDALQRYSWPGNVRESENVIERAVITSRDTVLQIEFPDVAADDPAPPAKTLAEIERAYILDVLTSKHWRIEGPKGAAAVLGLHPNTLRSRLQKLGIQRPA